MSGWRYKVSRNPLGLVPNAPLASALGKEFCPLTFSMLEVHGGQVKRERIDIYSYSVNTWCITSFPVCNLICFYVTSSFCLVFFVSEYKLNTNHIWIYVPPLFISTKDSSSFPLNFQFACCINVLYEFCVVCVV